MKKLNIIFYNARSLEKYMKKLNSKSQKVFSPRDISDKEAYSKSKPKFISTRKKYILTVSRLSEEKTPEHCIYALKYLSKEYELILIGIGEEEQKLKSLAKKECVYDRVHFIGFVKHEKLWQYYKCAKVFWLMSKTEASPNVIQEAMFAKVPVIVSNIVSFKLLIKNNTNGITLKTWDPKELAQKTLSLIKNKKLYVKIQKNGENSVKNNVAQNQKVSDYY